jgi:hypothetical protein
MSHLTAVGKPNVETLQVAISAPNQVRMTGSLTMRDPSKELMSYLRAIHDAALQDDLKELVVDITGLTFVNSSSIRLFVDWTTWLKEVPAGRRYRLKFRTSRQITWQKACFSALAVLADSVISVEHAA